MNISLEEAISLLEGWRMAGTEVRLHVSTKKGNREVRAVITSLTGTTVSIVADTEVLTLDLKGADLTAIGDPLHKPTRAPTWYASSATTIVGLLERR